MAHVRSARPKSNASEKEGRLFGSNYSRIPGAKWVSQPRKAVPQRDRSGRHCAAQE